MVELKPADIFEPELGDLPLDGFSVWLTGLPLDWFEPDSDILILLRAYHEHSWEPYRDHFDPYHSNSNPSICLKHVSICDFVYLISTSEIFGIVQTWAL
jgi:hypothetical protein